MTESIPSGGTVVVSSLPAPAIDSTSSDGDAITVNWTKNDDSSDGGFRVQLSSGDGFVTVAEVGTGTTSATVEPEASFDLGSSFPLEFQPADSYDVRVERYTDHATALSGTQSVSLLQPPGGLSLTTSDGQVTVTHDQESTASGGYTYYRAEYPGTWSSDYTEVGTNGSKTDTSFTDTTVEDGERYEYVVTSVSSSGTESGPSIGVSETTPLPAPSNVTASASGTTVSLSWTNQDNSSDGGIDIERRLGSSGAVTASSIHSKDITIQQDSFGTWVCVLNYEHYGGQNPSVGPGDTFPQLPNGLSTSSDIESNGSNGELRHVDNIDQYGSFSFDAVRLEATTENHSRKIHFFTEDQTVIDAILTEQSNETSYTDFQGSTTTLYDDHTANLPASASSDNADTRSDRIFGDGFPMYQSGDYHWAVAGFDSRWEVDDYADGAQFSTVHRVWIRATGSTETTVLDNAQNGSFSDVATGIEPSTTAYTDTTTVQDTSYQYQIERNTDHTTSVGPTTSIATIPNAPDGMALGVSVAGEIDLSWNDNSTVEDGYRIYRSTDGTNFSQIADLDPGTTSYTDTGLVDGDRYYYYVEAYNDAGGSQGSTVSDITVPGSPDLSVSFEDGAVALSWTKDDTVDVGEFEIYRSQSSGSLGSLLADGIDPSTTNYTDDTISRGTVYYYTVRRIV